MGDEQHDFGFEGEFEPWRDQLLQLIDRNELQGLCSRGLSENPHEGLVYPDFIVQVVCDAPLHDFSCSPSSSLRCYLPDRPLCPSSASLLGRIRRIDRLTAADHFQNVTSFQVIISYY